MITEVSFYQLPNDKSNSCLEMIKTSLSRISQIVEQEQKAIEDKIKEEKLKMIRQREDNVKQKLEKSQKAHQDRMSKYEEEDKLIMEERDKLKKEQEERDAETKKFEANLGLAGDDTKTYFDIFSKTRLPIPEIPEMDTLYLEY